jgi:general secretion pathway protein G
MKNPIRTHGFTLIELVIVIAVIAILAALLIPTILGQVERSRTSRAENDIGELARAVARLRVDTGSSVTGCVDVLTNLTAATGPTAACNPPNFPSNLTLASCTDAFVKPGIWCWGGPYVGVLPTDPWGDSYYATLNTSNYTVTFGSAGPDGVNGNSDDITYAQ